MYLYATLERFCPFFLRFLLMLLCTDTAILSLSFSLSPSGQFSLQKAAAPPLNLTSSLVSFSSLSPSLFA